MHASGSSSRGRPRISSPNYKTLGDRKVLDKKVPLNPKYAAVQAKVHTGARWRDNSTFTRPKRKNEFYGRIKSELLVQIIEENEEQEESLYNLASEGAMGKLSVVDAADMGSHGGGRGGESKPYLLLDMRAADEYEAFHIKNAYSYPITLLSRSTNCFNSLLLQYVNHPTSIVIVYCDDEKSGMAAAAKLSEKNVDNVYLLSGGLQHFGCKYSSYVAGELPHGYAREAPSGRSLSTAGSAASTRVGTARSGVSTSRLTTGGSARRGSRGGSRMMGGSSRLGSSSGSRMSSTGGAPRATKPLR